MDVLTLSVRNRLIGHGLKTHERISLIATILLDSDQVKVVELLSEDDAQTLIDLMDEVSPCTIPRPMGRMIDTTPASRQPGVG